MEGLTGQGDYPSPNELLTFGSNESPSSPYTEIRTGWVFVTTIGNGRVSVSLPLTRVFLTISVSMYSTYPTDHFKDLTRLLFGGPDRPWSVVTVILILAPFKAKPKQLWVKGFFGMSRKFP